MCGEGTVSGRYCLDSAENTAYCVLGFRCDMAIDQFVCLLFELRIEGMIIAIRGIAIEQRLTELTSEYSIDLLLIFFGKSPQLRANQWLHIEMTLL